MKTNTPHRVNTRFAPEKRFEVIPLPEALSRRNLAAKIEQLKLALVKEELSNARDPIQFRRLIMLANEAAALALTTPFPILVLPVLLEEKLEHARKQAERQNAIWSRSEQLFAEAV
jgi:hypothetical protein